MLNSAYNFMITGANFGNKGAQSMLFVTTDELRKRFPLCSVYFVSDGKYNESDYVFKKGISSRVLRAYTGGGEARFKAFCKGLILDAVKLIHGERNFFLSEYCGLPSHMSSMTALVDISGFTLGSKWGVKSPERYIMKIKLAKKYNVPVYLMPQSFGPFDYEPKIMQKITPLLSAELQYPRMIFAREKDGYDYLTQLFGLKNVYLSTDLVLQNKGVNPENIFRVKPSLSVPKITGNIENAAVIPNKRCFQHGNGDKILECYRKIIDYISGQGYRVVIFRHSHEDLEICRTLKNFYPDNENIVLFENDFSCLEYNEFVKQFKFIICSRYHGLVHAYKNDIPCVALGWAVKYRNLADVLGQSGYVFDITSENVDTEGIIKGLSCLLKNYEAEKITIREKLAEIQSRNCFDMLEEDLRKTGAVN